MASGIEDSEINSHLSSQLILNKGINKYIEERIDFLTNYAGKTGYPHLEGGNMTSLTLYKNQLKMDQKP
jgi:hypothetical protein